MIHIKTQEEIAVIKVAGQMLAFVKDTVRGEIGPGVTLAYLDGIAEKKVLELGGESAFKKVPGYRWTTCINVNDGVVHGIPGKYEIRPGDKISVDVGVYLNGFYTDSAFTMGVPPVSAKLKKFIDAGSETLDRAINEVRPGNRIGHVSRKIDETLRGYGYCPVYIFTGHGVGRDLHEEPVIPCFFSGKIEDTPLIQEGMVLAIEPIYVEGSPDLVIDGDGWTARTRDGKMGGLFEETVVATSGAPQIVTRLETQLL